MNLADVPTPRKETRLEYGRIPGYGAKENLRKGLYGRTKAACIEEGQGNAVAFGQLLDGWTVLGAQCLRHDGAKRWFYGRLRELLDHLAEHAERGFPVRAECVAQLEQLAECYRRNR